MSLNPPFQANVKHEHARQTNTSDLGPYVAFRLVGSPQTDGTTVQAVQFSPGNPLEVLCKQFTKLSNVHCDVVISPCRQEAMVLLAAIIIPLFAIFTAGETAAGVLVAVMAYIGLLGWYFNLKSVRMRRARHYRRRLLAEIDREIWVKRHECLQKLVRPQSL